MAERSTPKWLEKPVVRDRMSLPPGRPRAGAHLAAIFRALLLEEDLDANKDYQNIIETEFADEGLQKALRGTNSLLQSTLASGKLYLDKLQTFFLSVKDLPHRDLFPEHLNEVTAFIHLKADVPLWLKERACTDDPCNCIRIRLRITYAPNTVLWGFVAQKGIIY